jgi:hypothetical protein
MRRRVTITLLSVTITLGTTLGVVLTSSGSAFANVTYTCQGTPYVYLSRSCAAHVFAGAPLFDHNNKYYTTLPSNDIVGITCWYSGNPPSGYHTDGVWDHVIGENIPHPIIGHVPDWYVNFNGHLPNDPAIGLPHCPS